MMLQNLITFNKNESGIVRRIGIADPTKQEEETGVGDLEGRLLEMGFIEGAKLTVLHFGIWGKDPIAVRINNSNSIIAMRRTEAATIFLEKITDE